eukprot:TRINITY_DN7448_c0_g2_i2.p1 TRINITY_DN7448_c0_g2~~TRINITY_DN7448_c0_g2_i2.p1  ORF type:complete len:410 (+),score=94.00 TRINITY_DN7448_c0_g2_i2:54-1283(+)
MDIQTVSLLYALFMTGVMFALSVVTYRRYARTDGSKATAAIVVLAWTLSLSVAYLLPIDLYPDAAAFVQATAVWSFLYWFCFVSTWLVFPIQQGYETSGYFTFGAKLLDSVWQNLLFYVIAGALFIALVLAVSISKKISITQIQGFLMVLSNFWGFSLYVMLLGYGLVEIPREFWKAGGQSFHHRTLFYDAQKTHTQFEEAMDRIVESSRALKVLKDRLLKEKVADAENFTRYAEIIESLIPRDLFDYHRATREESKFVDSMKEAKLNVHIFAKIHARVKSDVIETRRTRYHFENIFDQVSEYFPGEEIGDLEEAAAIEVHAGPKHTVLRAFWRTLSVISGILSVIVLFSELTLPVKQNVSPFGQLLWAVRGNFAALQFFWLHLCLLSLFVLVLRTLQFATWKILLVTS